MQPEMIHIVKQLRYKNKSSQFWAARHTFQIELMRVDGHGKRSHFIMIRVVSCNDS